MNSSSKVTYASNSLTSKRLAYGKILIDTDSCRVTYEGISVSLLPKEYQLLLLFLEYPDHILSYNFIVDKLWQIEKIPTASNIRSHIKGLRKAFKKINNSQEIIETVHGLGYRLKPLEEEQSTNPLISPSFSALKDFFQAKAVEYVALNEEFIIKSISPGLHSYCDYPEALKVGIQAKDAFPEFIGLEEVFTKVINKELNSFEVKGIARTANYNRPEYISFYVVSNIAQQPARTTVMALPFNAAKVCANLRSLSSLTDQGDFAIK